MEVLSALGLNETVAVQFILFLCVFGFVYGVLFVPYFSAFTKRTERTVGNTETAEKIGDEVRTLEERYVSKARENNQQMKVAFDKVRVESQKESEAIVRQAREQNKRNLDEVQVATKSLLNRAEPEMKAESVTLGSGIVHKLLGKDLAT